jgi:hypothetical protein
MTTPRFQPKRYRATYKQRQQLDRAREQSNLKFIAQPSAKREKRAKKWLDEAPIRSSSRRDLDGEARMLARIHRENPASEQISEDMSDANVRALVNRGMRINYIYANGLDRVQWTNPALQSLLKKWDGLARKGLTRYQIETELARRLYVVQVDRRETRNPNRLLDLVREYYTTDARGRHRFVSHLTKAKSRRASRGRNAT